jgi:hypothetical protein
VGRPHDHAGAVNERWTSHDDVSRAVCCPDDAPCPFHARFLGAVLSPHMDPVTLERQTCPECDGHARTVDVATS